MAKKKATTSTLIHEIRELINDSILHHLFIKPPFKFDMMCSAMDTIGDTCLAISEFRKQRKITEIGMLYLLTYGLQQAFVIQQDAVTHLAEALNLAHSHRDIAGLMDIRNIRNRSSGHPTNKRSARETHPFNFIARHSLSLQGFSLHSTDAGKKTRIEHYENEKLIGIQEKAISLLLQRIKKDLVKMKRKEKTKYSSDSLKSIFHDVGYYFEKLNEEIYGSSIVHLGLTSLELIGGKTTEFAEKIRGRGLDMDAIEYEMETIPNSIQRIKSYLDHSDTLLNMHDALAHSSSLRGHLYSLSDMAKEIDEDYS